MTPHGLIELLYETDHIFGEGSVCPKLRDMHINPTSFQKMNVSLAMQVFLLFTLLCVSVLIFSFSLKVLSSSVSKGFEFYRTCPQLDEEIRLQFQNSQPLQEIIQLLNDTFDSMNARCPRDGVRMDNWPIKKEVFLKISLAPFSF